MDLPLLRKTLAWLGLGMAGVTLNAQAQTIETVVFLRDKVGSRFTTAQADSFLTPRSRARRTKFGIAVQERDRPVSLSYIAQIRSRGLDVVKASKWLNAVLVKGDSSLIQGLSNLPFVVSEQQVALKPARSDEGTPFSGIASHSSIQAVQEDFGLGQSQAHMLGIDSMHAAGYTGKGVLVAVLDAGFQSVLEHQAFTRLRDSGYLADTRDFVNNLGPNVFQGHWHGGGALSCIGGNFPGNFIGGAYQAKYALYVTEDNSREMPVEGFNWVVGAERADSLGADLISTSLGYSIFDKAFLSYRLDQMTGNTTLISQGVNIATQTGMLCVSSAGNEGQDFQWQGKITAPADAELGLTVGAVGPDSVMAGFSSRGFGGHQIKPDVVAQGVNCAIYSPTDPGGIILGAGTSFSCPLISGLVAGMMQEFPNLTPAQWIQALQRSATFASAPDTNHGYGIPSYPKVRRYLQSVSGLKENPKSLVLFPNPQASGFPVHLLLDSSEKLSQVTILNDLGQVVGNANLTPLGHGEYSFPIDNLASGAYRVWVELSSGTRAANLFVH